MIVNDIVKEKEEIELQKVRMERQYKTLKEEKAELINDKTKLEYMMQLSMQKQINQTNIEILENKLKRLQENLDQTSDDKETYFKENIQLKS